MSYCIKLFSVFLKIDFLFSPNTKMATENKKSQPFVKDTSQGVLSLTQVDNSITVDLVFGEDRYNTTLKSENIKNAVIQAAVKANFDVFCDILKTADIVITGGILEMLIYISAGSATHSEWIKIPKVTNAPPEQTVLSEKTVLLGFEYSDKLHLATDPKFIDYFIKIYCTSSECAKKYENRNALIDFVNKMDPKTGMLELLSHIYNITEIVAFAPNKETGELNYMIRYDFKRPVPKKFAISETTNAHAIPIDPAHRYVCGDDYEIIDGVPHIWLRWTTLV